MNSLNEDSLQYLLYTLTAGNMTVTLKNIPKYNLVDKIFNKILGRKIITFRNKLLYIEKYRIKYYNSVLNELVR